MIALPADLPAWLRFWCDGLLRASIEGGVAIGLAWAACALLPRLPATVRCWLWRLAYLKLLVALLIPLPIRLPVLPSGSAPVAQARYYAEAGSQPFAAAAPGNAGPGGDAGAVGLVGMTLFTLWSAGVLWSLVRVTREWREARRLRAESRPAADPWIEERCAELAFLFNLRRAPRILVAEGRGSPLLIGSGGPAVLLPAALVRDYAPEEVELMLAHELAHLKRGDLAWSRLPALVHGLFFFHPLVWLANREWRLAQEMACDELALEITSAPAGEYGQVLVRVAAQSRLNLQAGLATVGLEETPDTLKRRLSAMKLPQRFSPVRLSALSAPVVLLGAALLLPWKLAAADGGTLLPPQALRHAWQPGRSYSYQVTIDAEHPDYQDRHTGTLTYTAAQVGDTLALTHSGSLFNHRVPKSPGAFRVPSAPPIRSFSLGFGPDSGRGGIRFDALGRILEQREGGALPYSLGSIARMVVEPLVEGRVGAWEARGDREIQVDEPEQAAFPHSRSPFFREPGLARLAGHEWARYSVTEARPEAVTIRRRSELRTVDAPDGSPRLLLAGEGRLTWDVRQGLPRELDWRGTVTEASANLTRRTPITFRYELQEAERAIVAPKKAAR